MSSRKVGGLKCIGLTTQFWLKKGLIGENIFIWGEEIQIWIAKVSMRILEGLINLIEDLIAGKSIFWINLGVNWNKLNYGDLIGFLGGFIGQIKGLIVRILKFDGWLNIWLKKSKTNDKTKKGAWL